MTQRLRPTAVVVAGLATAGLALSACGSDSLDSTILELSSLQLAPRPARRSTRPWRPSCRPRSRTPARSSSAPTPPTRPTSSSTPTARPWSAWTSTCSTRSRPSSASRPNGCPPASTRSSSASPAASTTSASPPSPSTTSARSRPRWSATSTAGTQWVTQKGNPKKVDPDNACGLNVAVQKGTVQADGPTAKRQKACTGRRQARRSSVLVDADQAKVTATVQSGQGRRHAGRPPAGHTPCSEPGGTLELLGEQYDSAPYGFVAPEGPRPTSARPSSTPSRRMRPTAATRRSSSKWKTEGGAISDFAVNPDRSLSAD